MLLRFSFNLCRSVLSPPSISTVRMSSSTTSLVDIVANLECINDTIKTSTAESSLTSKCRLVAVSKTKPAELIKACYYVGQRHFGENYVQELQEKSVLLKETCPDIRWHYIGQVQSNKIPKICTSSSLYCVETIESEKHCQAFEKEMAKLDRTLEVFVQVNTSREDQKGGVLPEDAHKLASYIKDQCPHLRFVGFMTIGSFEHSHQNRNPDFDTLYSVRDDWCKKSGDSKDLIELSMGMSDDYTTAIAQGSTSVRVGSKLFGARLYKK